MHVQIKHLLAYLQDLSNSYFGWLVYFCLYMNLKKEVGIAIYSKETSS